MHDDCTMHSTCNCNKLIGSGKTHTKQLEINNKKNEKRKRERINTVYKQIINVIILIK